MIPFSFLTGLFIQQRKYGEAVCKGTFVEEASVAIKASALSLPLQESYVFCLINFMRNGRKNC